MADLGGVQRESITQAAFQDVAEDLAKELKGERLTAEKSAQMANTQTAQRSRTKGKKKTSKTRSKTVTKLMKAQKEKRLLPVEKIKDEAGKHERKNPELKANVLKMLRERVKPSDTKEEILAKVKDYYPDDTLADDAMDFLLDTTEGELYKTVQEAKDDHLEEKGREISAGRNISAQARAAAEKGLGTPTSMRDMYRDITGNPRDANTLFDELSTKFAYKELAKVIKFLFHSLGSDMKAKGPSIPRGELHNLMTETRTLQAILGVYRFFSSRMKLVKKMFKEGGLKVPDRLNFETMSKAFMGLVRERYPSADKVLGKAQQLDIEDWILAKIIAFSQFRDSVRELAMSQIYRSLQHRDDVLMAIIEALEDLEEELEEEEEEEEEEELWEEEEEEEEEEE